MDSFPPPAAAGDLPCIPWVQFEQLCQSLPVGLAIIDRQLRCLRANPHLALLSGVDAAQLPGRPLEQVVPPFAAALSPLILQVFDSGEPAVDTELSNGADPARRWLVSCRPLKTKEGVTCGVGLIVLDAAPAGPGAKTAAIDLTAVMRTALAAHVVRAIAHEVNQPLCAVVANAQAVEMMLAQKEPDMDEVRAALRDIISEGMRAAEIVRRSRSLLGGPPAASPPDAKEPG